MLFNLRVISGIEPGPACELRQAERIQQHAPEIRQWRTTAWRMSDRIAKEPECGNTDECQRPEIRQRAFEIQRIHSTPAPVSENAGMTAQHLTESERPSP